MALEDALRVLPEYWPDVRTRLDPDKQRELLLLAERLDGPDRLRAASILGDLLVEALPPDHPVRRALASGHLFQASPVDWARLRARLGRLTVADLAAPPVTGDVPGAAPDSPGSLDSPESSMTPGSPGSPPGAGTTGSTVLAQVTARLLRAPALSESEVRVRGEDPGDPVIIRLSRPDGGRQWPAFQFTPAGGLPPVVRAVNLVLDAARDPVGAADWWLSRNRWLEAQPSALIGVVPDEHLLSAARALGVEV